MRETAATAGWSGDYVRWLTRQVYRKLVRLILAADTLPRG